MLKIGCHLSKEKGFLSMAEETTSIDGNTFQYFTRNPRGGAAKALDSNDIDAFKKYVSEKSLGQIVAYAPYTVEPASEETHTRDFAKMVMSEDLLRLEEIPGQYYLIRPGSGIGISTEKAVSNVADALNEVISSSMSTTLLIDTEAGEGSQVGWKFEQIAKIIEGTKLSGKLGVCLDASAVWAAGYDIAGNLDGVLDEFDSKIGISKLKVIHLNDSAEPLGSRKDKHVRIGTGKIGFEALSNLTKDPRTKDATFILEEHDATLELYGREIQRFREAL